MKKKLIFILITTFLNLSQTLCSEQCDEWDPQPLRSDQLTVILSGYSTSRIPLLISIAASYSSQPIVASVIILWGNPNTPTQTLTHLSQNLSLSSATITLIPQPTRSLNLRFLPRAQIRTRAVLIADDDVEIDAPSIAFAFRVWRGNPDRLIGFFARSHDLDLSSREWIYTVHGDRYSMVLTKAMIAKSEYLYKYSCEGGDEMARARRVVEEMRNCEDILMNFVAAEEARVGPVMVGAKWVRDWGDARNGRRRLRDENEDVVKVGLSSRRLEHRKKRGKCIREFHRVLGKMSLRYSYGKVVNSVREQGLCRKGGKLVYCDRD